MSEMVVPDGWNANRFDSFTTLQRGSDLPVQYRNGTKHLIIGSNGVVGTHDIPSVVGPCVITGRSGSIGKVLYVVSDCWALNTTLYVKDFHQNDRKFVYYFLTWFDLQRFESGTGVPTLNRNDVHSVSVVFPPLPEQQKIAAILTSVDDVIEKTQAQIDKLQDLKKGTMNQLLTRGIGHAEFKESPVGMIPVDWEVKQVSSVTSKVGSGVTPRGGSEVYQSEGVKFLRSQNVHFSGLRLDGVACIASEVHEGMSSSKVREGDVLLNITGASIGRCALVPKGIGEANVNQHVCIIRTTSVVDGAFVTYWLSSTCGQSQINKFQAGGNREGLNFQQIKAISISLPSISEQQKITSILTAIDTQIEAKQDKLKHTQALKKALMQDLLTGKKRVAA